MLPYFLHVLCLSPHMCRGTIHCIGHKISNQSCVCGKHYWRNNYESITDDLQLSQLAWQVFEFWLFCQIKGVLVDWCIIISMHVNKINIMKLIYQNNLKPFVLISHPLNMSVFRNVYFILNKIFLHHKPGTVRRTTQAFCLLWLLSWRLIGERRPLQI